MADLAASAQLQGDVAATVSGLEQFSAGAHIEPAVAVNVSGILVQTGAISAIADSDGRFNNYERNRVRMTGRISGKIGSEVKTAVGNTMYGTGLDGSGGGGGGDTDLGVANRDEDSLEITSSTGDAAVVPSASTSEAGLMSAADKTKLDGIEASADANVPANLSVANKTGTTLDIASSSGSDATVPAATDTEAGLLTAANKVKLDGIEALAEVNVDTNLSVTNKTGTTLDIASSTGADATIPAATGTEAGLMTAADKVILDGLSAASGTDLSLGTIDDETIEIESSTGDDVVLPAATDTEAGLMTAPNKVKLDGIEDGAEVNVPTDLSIANKTGTTLDIASSTGNDATVPAATGTDAGLMTAAHKTKLDGIADGATVYTDELAQDAVGNILADSDTIELVYTDGTPDIVANLKDGAVSLAKLASGLVDTDGTLAANSDSVIASQKAVKTYVDQIIAAQDAMVFKGVIDASGNPNYPAADRGHTYRISVAGKIGGGSGVNVEVGDLIICLTDGTSAGNQATVGSAWTIVQTNLDGAVIGPVSVTDADFAQFDGTSGKLIKGGLALDTDTALAADSDAKIPSQKAVKAYADTKQPLDADLTALAALASTGLLRRTGANTYSLGTQVATGEIADDAVTLAKIADIADQTILGNNTGGAASPVALTASQTRTVLGLGALALLATVGTSQIDNDAVTYAKLQNISNTDRLLGRDTAGAGDAEEITVGGGLEFTGSGGIQRSALTGDVTASAGNNGTTIANNAVTLAKMADMNTDRLLGRDTASSGDPEEISVGNGLEFTGGPGIGMSSNQRQGQIVVVIGDGTNDITTGVKGYLPVNIAGTITRWDLVADASGAIVIDVWKDTYANFPPVDADSIAGSELPTLSSVQKNQDTSLSTWTTSLSVGDVLGFNVDSASGVKQVTLVITFTKS